MTLLFPEQIDELFQWPLGRASRLARRGKLSHIRLPNGEIRFDEDEVSSLIERVPADKLATEGTQ